MKNSTGKASGSLAWAVYVVILFEMIYMSTPLPSSSIPYTAPP